ncbi:translation initiation factor eIF2B subunit delta [Spizellomyces punctatus DAOM BR117]|uniref:Translation initiation factor eIF2B subunit delta n=1 Tax=Spizellomyces punctatus (strain DAOM BR117) TaxID=645134 RepID=A0A0L0HLJ7_SPIPD|nr:translation initiation factor eIF2B subunit delta [Spizellomyces punctatus DAOM BR117]KND01679.1 hypothetical protein SPPG_03473 [Spizellomyces punctatus DAOM BR117]|eukprot:XP_016609718.1 hypothetical protein SPPG_03473 [Spizellomyces punctatus DAOM BR117]
MLIICGDGFFVMASKDKEPIRNTDAPPRSVVVGFDAPSPSRSVEPSRRPSKADAAGIGKPSRTSSANDAELSAELAKKGGEGSQNPAKKSQKEMTKAERRELQERQRAEKKAREAAGIPKRLPKPKQGGGTPGQTAAAGFAAHNAQNSQPDMKQPSPNAAVLRVASSMRLDDPRKRSKAQKQQPVNRQIARKPVGLFSHLPQYEKHDNMQARLKKQENIHPAVLTLGLRFAEFVIAGGNARCMAMLQAFKKVISDYVTPVGMSLPRHLPSVISKQVDFLSNTRVLAASMKTAIRELKKEISISSPDTPDEDAKTYLIGKIDEFIVERIITAGRAIAEEALEQKKSIKDGDVILTFGRSSVVLQLLLAAHARGINFKVIVADGRPKLEGKEILKSLVHAGISCAYVFCTAVPLLMKEVTKVIIGASAVLANGAVLSRVGTSVVCNAAKELQVPVIVLCESYKFSEEVRLDSFTWNEIGNPDELVDVSNRAPSEHAFNASTGGFQSDEAGVIGCWRSVDKLKLLNLHYDVTPAHFVTALICEHGTVPSTCALTIARLAAEKSA